MPTPDDYLGSSTGGAQGRPDVSVEQHVDVDIEIIDGTENSSSINQNNIQQLSSEPGDDGNTGQYSEDQSNNMNLNQYGGTTVTSDNLVSPNQEGDQWTPADGLSAPNGINDMMMPEQQQQLSRNISALSNEEVQAIMASASRLKNVISATSDVFVANVRSSDDRKKSNNSQSDYNDGFNDQYHDNYDGINHDHDDDGDQMTSSNEPLPPPHQAFSAINSGTGGPGGSNANSGNESAMDVRSDGRSMDLRGKSEGYPDNQQIQKESYSNSQSQSVSQTGPSYQYASNVGAEYQPSDEKRDLLNATRPWLKSSNVDNSRSGSATENKDVNQPISSATELLRNIAQGEQSYNSVQPSLLRGGARSDLPIVSSKNNHNNTLTPAAASGSAVNVTAAMIQSDTSNKPQLYTLPKTTPLVQDKLNTRSRPTPGSAQSWLSRYERGDFNIRKREEKNALVGMLDSINKTPEMAQNKKGNVVSSAPGPISSSTSTPPVNILNPYSQKSLQSKKDNITEWCRMRSPIRCNESSQSINHYLSDDIRSNKMTVKASALGGTIKSNHTKRTSSVDRVIASTQAACEPFFRTGLPPTIETQNDIAKEIFQDQKQNRPTSDIPFGSMNSISETLFSHGQPTAIRQNHEVSDMTSIAEKHRNASALLESLRMDVKVLEDTVSSVIKFRDERAYQKVLFLRQKQNNVRAWLRGWEDWWESQKSEFLRKASIEAEKTHRDVEESRRALIQAKERVEKLQTALAERQNTWCLERERNDAQTNALKEREQRLIRQVESMAQSAITRKHTHANTVEKYQKIIDELETRKNMVESEANEEKRKQDEKVQQMEERIAMLESDPSVKSRSLHVQRIALQHSIDKFQVLVNKLYTDYKEQQGFAFGQSTEDVGSGGEGFQPSGVAAKGWAQIESLDSDLAVLSGKKNLNIDQTLQHSAQDENSKMDLVNTANDIKEQDQYGQSQSDQMILNQKAESNVSQNQLVKNMNADCFRLDPKQFAQIVDILHELQSNAGGGTSVLLSEVQSLFSQTWLLDARNRNFLDALVNLSVRYPFYCPSEVVLKSPTKRDRELGYSSTGPAPQIGSQTKTGASKSFLNQNFDFNLKQAPGPAPFQSNIVAPPQLPVGGTLDEKLNLNQEESNLGMNDQNLNQLQELENVNAIMSPMQQQQQQNAANFNPNGAGSSDPVVHADLGNISPIAEITVTNTGPNLVQVSDNSLNDVNQVQQKQNEEVQVKDRAFPSSGMSIPNEFENLDPGQDHHTVPFNDPFSTSMEPGISPQPGLQIQQADTNGRKFSEKVTAQKMRILQGVNSEPTAYN